MTGYSNESTWGGANQVLHSNREITLPPPSKTDLTNSLLRRFKLHVNSFLNIGVRHSILRFAGEQLTNLRKDQ